jgi:hypothetical protein
MMVRVRLESNEPLLRERIHEPLHALARDPQPSRDLWHRSTGANGGQDFPASPRLFFHLRGRLSLKLVDARKRKGFPEDSLKVSIQGHNDSI